LKILVFLRQIPCILIVHKVKTMPDL